ncbi:MAG: ABC transporter ATP-binding protein [Mesotoga sp.]|uniref:ABC transporter ATP-binding protein n=1 Tax=unclassified Mesotoga TaxID=1184398 RepID=UPI000EF24EB4|nr:MULTISPECIES: ABC transporter ATP-binding protein [unclassified Mesotoga]MDI9368853.1 ABC transporter ATP-binding protein [Thermotogota bacterium]NLT45992.1 ABC transporter ATP-binding protein [Thermotogaceae bacterium]MDD2333958.1 ABC transporter ATP-binding protein [Mesotoga sp.]MDD3680823.1 ABC transporter ATP-binding protein [Mesotoga sp.]MDD4206853.1 ABC transporter ATP-binding protein [Mesotoga sp.]
MIEALNLTRSFGSLIAVDQVNLTIPSGEIYGFLGPNGAGKTTTIKMLTGVIAPSSGKIKIAGLDIERNKLEIKGLISVVPDEPKMYDNLKGVEFVKFIIDIYRLPPKETMSKLMDIADAFKIDYLGKYIGDYSHGMKQKLMVAIALMREPTVIFLDEPTVGLDASSAGKLKAWLRNMADKGTTVFMTTHVLEVAEKMCDRIGIIDRGRLIAEGTLSALREDFGSVESTLEELFLDITGDSSIDALVKSLQEGM